MNKSSCNNAEYRIHCAIKDYLNLVIKKPSRWHTVEVSNQASGYAAMIKQKALKTKGVVTGWPDIELFWFCDNKLKMIFLEVKIPMDKPKEHQRILHDELREEGHLVYVVHSVHEVQAIFKELGII